MTSQFSFSVSSHTVSAQRIVFIDATVGDRQTLVNNVAPGTAVVLLDANRNGVEQITETLALVDSIGSLHIVSHGAPGYLFLGNTQLSLETLSLYAPQIEQWNSAFSANPSILLYGCNVAAGDAGAEFVESLHALTHANIGASQTLTGNAALGGNWQLEVTTGAIAPLAFAAEALARYEGVLASVTLGDATWDVQNEASPETGNIASSNEGGLAGLDSQILRINGQVFDADPFDDGQMGDTVTGVSTIGDLETTVQYKAVAGLNGEPVLRTFVTVKNLGDATTASLALEADTAAGEPAIQGSSSGDLEFDVSDRFVITEAPGGTAGINTFAFYSSDAPSSATLNPQSLTAAYNDFNLAAGASKSFIFFNSISTTVLEATTESAQFSNADALASSGLLTGLTSAQLSAAGINPSNGNLIITPTSGSTTEAGGIATFNVVLSRQPSADVTVNLASSDPTEGTIIGSPSLTFTADNFNVPQTITVKGVDDAVVDGNVAYSVQTTFTSTDEFFGATVNPDGISLTNTDNDTTLTPTPTPTPTPSPRPTPNPAIVTGRTIVGTSGKDTLIGTDGNDIILGKGDNDKLIGNGGNDILKGGAGKDVLRGGVGADTLNGGADKDKLFGGDGNDVFVIARKKGADVIRDYQDGQDKIDLAGSLTFGSLTLVQKGKDTVLSSGSEVLATLKGVAKGQLSATDFT